MARSLERGRTLGWPAPVTLPRSGLGWANLSSRVRGFLPLVGLGFVTLVVFWNDITAGVTYYGGDTLAFYYPLTSWYGTQLKAGHLPLWLPLIYGGYPLFADGEVGMLYPLNLLAFGLLPNEVAFVWLRPVHFWLAGAFTYWFCRLLGQTRPAALLAALSFGFGSFLVSHLQHENIIRSSIWLPGVLGCMEHALRVRGARRLFWLVACATGVAVQLLGVHVQPVLLTLLALGAYSLIGPLGNAGMHPARGWRWLAGEVFPGLRRLDFSMSTAVRGGAYLCSRVAAVLFVTSLAVGLAAVQIVPLYQLGERSMRAGGVSYEFSTSYSIPPTQLLQLVLPYLFRPEGGVYIGLWSAVETTLYLGLIPLALAMVALAYLGSRAVAAFGLMAGLSLLLALGDYLPLKLYTVIWSLPGFSYLRVPGRFGLLFLLAAAILAGFGADWLASRRFDSLGGHRLRIRRLALLAIALGFGAIGLALVFAQARSWLISDPAGTRAAIETYYLSLRRGDWNLSASAVYFGLLRVLDLANPRTSGGLALMVAAALALLLRGHRGLHRAHWLAGVLIVTAVDLAIFAHGFNPQRPIASITPSTPGVRFLNEHAGLHRVFIEPGLFNALGPNQLVGSAVDVAGGYSSLEPRRASEYWWSMVRQDTTLLDLMNVRYVVSAPSTAGLLAYEGALYHPADRLMRAAAGSTAAVEVFDVRPAWTESISIVGAGIGTAGLPVGEPLAEITVSGPEDERRVLVRAGMELGDEARPLYGPRLLGDQFGPRIVWAGPAFQSPGQLSVLYGSTLELPQPQMATRVTVRVLSEAAGLDLHGIGLHDRPGLPVRSIRPADRAKYRSVYRDDDVSILENRAALPRAFLVGLARWPRVEEGPLIDLMLLRSFDPRQIALLEGPPIVPVTAPDGSSPGSAQIVQLSADRVVVRTEAERPAFLVLTDRYDDSWKARVDGREVPLYRADVMFRAVQVEAGGHDVVFTYEPAAVQVGLIISACALALTMLGGALAYGLRRSRSARSTAG